MYSEKEGDGSLKLGRQLKATESIRHIGIVKDHGDKDLYRNILIPIFREEGIDSEIAVKLYSGIK